MTTRLGGVQQSGDFSRREIILGALVPIRGYAGVGVLTFYLLPLGRFPSPISS
jgi:hypothetical protein